MRHNLISVISAAVLGFGATMPALANDSGSFFSMQAALGVATNIGLATVSRTEFAGDEWQIEGRDIYGQHLEVDVDAHTGAVLNVDR